jgi:hypothetical protein
MEHLILFAAAKLGRAKKGLTPDTNSFTVGYQAEFL